MFQGLVHGSLHFLHLKLNTLKHIKIELNLGYQDFLIIQTEMLPWSHFFTKFMILINHILCKTLKRNQIGFFIYVIYQGFFAVLSVDLLMIKQNDNAIN